MAALAEADRLLRVVRSHRRQTAPGHKQSHAPRAQSCRSLCLIVDSAGAKRSHRLLSERAESLGGAERATFLGNVPSHRAIVAAWKHRGRALPAGQ